MIDRHECQSFFLHMLQPFVPYISEIYCTSQKMRNSIRSQIEECICCGSTVNAMDATHNHSSSKDQVKLVVYSPHSGSNTIKDDQLKETEMNGEIVV